MFVLHTNNLLLSFLLFTKSKELNEIKPKPSGLEIFEIVFRFLAMFTVLKKKKKKGAPVCVRTGM